MIANVQLPPGATQSRTLSVMQQVEGFFLKQPEVSQMVSVLGFSFSGSGQNAALAFVTLKPWDEREGPEHSAQGIAGRAFGALSKVRDAFIFALCPPPIPELGTATGFTFRLQDRGGNGHDALLAARNQLLGDGGAEQDPRRRPARRPGGRAAAAARHRPRQGERAGRLVRRDQRGAVDRARLDLRQRLPECRPAAARGRAGRRAGAHAARRPAADQRAQQPGQAGAAVGLRDDALDHRADRRPSATTATRRCASPATPRPGYSTGDAMAEMERLAAQLPAGFGFEWTGQSREEQLVGRDRRRSCSASRCWRCSCAWRRSTRAGRSRSR